MRKLRKSNALIVIDASDTHSISTAGMGLYYDHETHTTRIYGCSFIAAFLSLSTAKLYLKERSDWPGLEIRKVTIEEAEK